MFSQNAPPSGFPGSKFIHNYLGGNRVGESRGVVESGEYVFFNQMESGWKTKSTRKSG